ARTTCHRCGATCPCDGFATGRTSDPASAPLRQADQPGAMQGRAPQHQRTGQGAHWRHTVSPTRTWASTSNVRRRGPAVTTTTYLGSGDASRHRRDYRPDWLDNLADDVTIEGSVLTGIAEGPEAIRAILGFARTLYDYQEFNYVGPYGDDGFVEDYTS